jgi:uncharacterized protein (TIGR02588 family)
MTQRVPITAWEWIAAVASAAIVLSAMVTLLIAGKRERTPPLLSVRVEGSEQAGSHYRVRFVVRNDGGTTAAEVVVRGELRTSTPLPEASDVTFDFVPDGSERRGALIFATDPESGHLSIRPLGYREP